MSLLGSLLAPVYGAWRLLRFDRGGLAYMDLSPAGVTASFAAIPLSLPSIATVVLVEGRLLPAEMKLAYLVLHLAALLASWLLYLVIVEKVAVWLERGPVFPRFVAAYNWTYLLVSTLEMGLALLSLTGLFAASGGVFVGIFALAALVVATFVLMVSLRLDAVGAVLLVLLEAVLQVTLESLVSLAMPH